MMSIQIPLKIRNFVGLNFTMKAFFFISVFSSIFLSMLSKVRMVRDVKVQLMTGIEYYILSTTMLASHHRLQQLLE